MGNIKTLVLVLLFSLSGCTMLLVPDPPDCVLVTGTVVDSMGGNLVSGASVFMDDKMVLSDENGRFSLKVSPFKHDLMAFKEGHAGSRIQDVLTKPDTQPELTIILPYCAINPELTEPPTLITSGLQNGQRFSFSLYFHVFGYDGDYPIGIDSDSIIFLQVGSGSQFHYDDWSNTGDLYCYISSGMLPPGKSNIKMVIYDKNNNRCELNKEIEYIPPVSSSSDLPTTPNYQDLIVSAFTFSSSRNLLNTSRSTRGGQADEDGSTVLVELMMNIKDSTNGFSAYRLDESTGDYILVGQIAEETVIYEGTTIYYLLDASPSLVPGTTQKYRVNYFNDNGNSENFWIEGIEILPETSLLLTSPSDFSIVSTTHPTFTWECDLKNAKGNFYLNVTNSYGLSVWEGSVGNNKSFELPVALSIGEEYVWNVTGGMYRIQNTNSWSFWYQNQYHGSANGAFTFTVLPEEKP